MIEKSMQASIPLIQMENIEKVFLTDEVETHALSAVKLEIHHGDYVSISGPSGCGKSTLLSILGLLDSPTSGSYELRGEPVANLNYAQRARVKFDESAWTAIPEGVPVKVSISKGKLWLAAGRVTIKRTIR